ncbi:MAG: M56 family metallopeptidase [Gammaproteobacteria bacterium]|nr:M56 family metallopeptidase [Gammaproteobacteria bacterium]
MREHVAPFVYYLEVHVLCASLLCLATWALTSIKGGSATWKYWMWVVTSVNFVVPLAGFFNGFGSSHVSWATQLGTLADVGIGISRSAGGGLAFLCVWLCGALFMFTRLLVHLHRDRGESPAIVRSGPTRTWPLLADGVPVTFSTAAQCPSVGGLLRPHISLPLGVDGLLTRNELDAVLMHEVTHARRRDNLIGLVHEIALCGLWFHPLVWLTGSRLAMFRELSCDDSVIASSRGADLVTALAKLADPGESRLLRVGAATLFRHRVARLKASHPHRAQGAADLALILIYAGVLVACALATIAHTPSCFNVAA